MKEFNCYDCKGSFKAETRDEILNILYDHYMKDHHDIITGNSEEEKKTWMAKFDADWSATKEI